MAETYYAASYWLARPESAEACARRAETFFRLLRACEPGWRSWYETADSFEQAREREVRTDAASLLRLFGQQGARRPGGGIGFWLWAGDTPEQTSRVQGRCGAETALLSSLCLLTPPAQGPLAERVVTAPVLSEVLRAMALAWEPEWAIATSDAHRAQVTQRPKEGTFVGWVMYFSRQRGRLPPLPAPVRVEPVGELGSLVLLTPERFSVSRPEHVELAARVHALLEDAGLLGPLRPMTTR